MKVSNALRRRDLVKAAAGLIVGWPNDLHAKGRASRLIGYLGSGSPSKLNESLAKEFCRGLQEQGYATGDDLAMAFAWAESDLDRLFDLAADLAHDSPDLLVASSGPIAAAVAHSAAPKKPLVFIMAADPIGLGLVRSLDHPDRNATGVIMSSDAAISKRLQLLRSVATTGKLIGFLINSNAPQVKLRVVEATQTARQLGIQVLIRNATKPVEIDEAFEILARQKFDAVMIDDDALFLDECVRLAALARRYGIPAIHAYRESVEHGGLMSLGVTAAAAWRIAGVCAGRILMGAPPGDIPVHVISPAQIAVNVATARSLGVDIPASLLAQADAVIEEPL